MEKYNIDGSQEKNIFIYVKMLCISCEQSERQTKYHIDKENPVLVTTSDEVAGLPVRQPFKFICKRCEKEIVINEAGERAANRFTGYCVNCYQSVFRSKTIDGYITMTCPEDFDRYYSRHQKFIIKCKKCGKIQKHDQYYSYRVDKYKSMLCTSCMRSEALTGNKNGIIEGCHDPVMIEKPEDFDKLTTKKPYFYYCASCGKLQFVKSFDRRKIDSNKVMLCENCSKSKIYYDDLYEAKRQCEISHGVEIWSENECLPYIQYVEETYGKSFLPKLRLESIKKRNEIMSQI